MRSFINFGALAIANCQLEFLQEVSDANLNGESQSIFNRFGNYEQIIKQESDYIEKIIHIQGNEFHMDYRQQAAHIQELTQYVKGEKQHQSLLKTDEPLGCHTYRGNTTDDPDSTFMFFPAFTGKIDPENNTLSFEGNCFEHISMEMNYQEHDSSVELIVKTEKPRNHTCSDMFVFGNNQAMHVEDFFFRGTHKLTFKLPNEVDQEDMEAVGFSTFLFCESYRDETLSLIQTLKGFMGGLGLHGKVPLFQPQPPPYMIEANLEFLKWAAHMEFETRPVSRVDIDEDLIQSGDYIAIMRLDGLDPMIMYGTGSHSGHSVMALRFDGELYIVESQDAWYWPTHRIQRNKFSEWIDYAERADFHVALMPLSDEKRAQFNETAAQERFFELQGTPYGFHNFLMSFMDTDDDSIPLLLPKDLVGPAFSLLERIDKNLTDLFIGQSLNKHLGTEGLNITEIQLEAAKRGMNFTDVAAVVEEDGWIYSGYYHDGESLVCSCFVTAMWKAAGLFGDMEINSVEQSPKDIYQMDIFNKNWDRPQVCKDADPGVNFCQLLGSHRMEFPGFSSIEPYPHMNDKCTSLPPYFIRGPEGC